MLTQLFHPPVLLFVFWYCHKRGRETRLAASSLENSTASLDDPEKGTVDDDAADADDRVDDEGEDVVRADAPVEAEEEEPAARAQVDVAVAEAKQVLPSEADRDAQAVLEQQDPKEVDLPESPRESRAGTGDQGAGPAVTTAESK